MNEPIGVYERIKFAPSTRNPDRTNFPLKGRIKGLGDEGGGGLVFTLSLF
jgi:hypothetical protein